MRRTLKVLVCTLLTLGSVTLASTAAAQDDIDREGERCISVTRLRSTHVVDDRTVLFYMRGGDIYRNVLRHDCPGLKRENRFSYKVSVSRLCSVQTITVLEDFGGSLSRGISCGLGKFYQISKDEADFLRYGERSDIQAEPEAVDLPDDDETP